jgi:preprotein translocase subunit SecD
MRRSGTLSLVVITVVAVGWLTYTLTLGGRTPQLGLDLQGGISVVLGPKGQVASSSLDQSISIIRRRVDGLGVAEPEITRQGDFIVVSLPGIKDPQRAIDVVGRTAKLQFRPFCTQLPVGLPDSTYQSSLDPTAGGPCVTPATSATPTDSSGTSTSVQSSVPPAPIDSGANSLGIAPQGHLSAAQTTDTTAPADTATTAPGDTATTAPGDTGTTATTVPGETTTVAGATAFPCGTTGDQAATAPDEQPVIAPDDENKDGKFDSCDVLGPVALSGTAVDSAQAAIPQGSWVVELTLKDSGLDQFNKLSSHCFNHEQVCQGGRTAIVLDGEVQSNPAPQTPTFQSTQIEISGSFDQRKADDLALVLNYGALPVELVQQRVETVSPTLGRDSLHAGLAAGLVGIAAVAIYMVLYYRALGIIVILGLGIWSALNYSIITYLSGSSGLALSLSGVTGIVVSVGVTTDSYIVYFERIKDEVKSGKTVRSAVDHAFKRAWRTILSADLASFLGAAVLYWLTVGAVRGFAFFLGLSTLLDLLTAYFFKRPLVAMLARSRFLTEARWIGIRAGLADSEHRVMAPAGGGR